MVSSVNNVSTKPKMTNASFFTVNDVHAQVVKMEKIKTAAADFDRFTPREKTDKFKFSSGDIALGEDKGLNKVAYDFEKSIGIDAGTLGNHECDTDVKTMADLIRGENFDILAMNVKVK